MEVAVMTKISTAEARNEFAEVINRASFGKERFVLTRRGKELVAIVPVEDLALLEELEDQMDVEAAKAALVESDERVSYQDLRRELGLE
jgi:prevent-host-death family protein